MESIIQLESVHLNMSKYNVLFAPALFDAELDFDQAHERTTKFLDFHDLSPIENNSLIRLFDQTLERDLGQLCELVFDPYYTQIAKSVQNILKGDGDFQLFCEGDMFISRLSTFKHFNTIVTALLIQSRCCKVSVWVDLLSKFFRMFLSSVYCSDTDVLLVPLDFAQ